MFPLKYPSYWALSDLSNWAVPIEKPGFFLVSDNEALSAELAITNLVSNKGEWNNCFIKFSTFGLLNFIKA